MSSLRLTWVLTILLCISSQVVNTQLQGCSLRGIDFQQCLDQDESSLSFDSCCKALSQVVQAGYYCFCLLIRSSVPMLGITLSLQLANCYISVPPLTQCQKPLPALGSPATPVPALNHPPARPVLPVQMPPQIPKEQPRPSAPNDFMVPLPPKVNEIPLSPSAINSSTLSSNNVPKILLHPTFLLAVVLYAIM